MAERDPLTDEHKGIDPTTVNGASDAQGAKAAAEGAGNPEVPSVGTRAESHHVAHAGSKAGQREDDENLENSGNEPPDPSRINPIADEQSPPGAPAGDRPQVEESRGDRVQPGPEPNVP